MGQRSFSKTGKGDRIYNSMNTCGRYEPRTYRQNVVSSGTDLLSFSVSVRETDLFIRSDRDLTAEALHAVHKYRSFIENYIALYPHFLHAKKPLVEDQFAPDIVKDMIKATKQVGVGPMASVAGAIAESVGCELLRAPSISNVIVENGGDIYLNCKDNRHVCILAGESPLSGKMNLLIRSEQMPLGVCTSSGTVGHSLSYGLADAVCVVASSVALADAAATAIGNHIHSEKDIRSGLKIAERIHDIQGVVIICNDQCGIAGEIELL